MPDTRILTIAEDIPANVDVIEPGRNGLGTVGRFVAIADFITAVSNFGTEQYLLCPMNISKEALWRSLGARSPVPLIRPRQMVELASKGAVVHELGRHRLSRFCRLRSSRPGRWGPITAQAHGLGYDSLLTDICLAILGGNRVGDVIFSPSVACGAALENAIQAALEVVGRDDRSVGPEVVHIPLGIDTQQLERTATDVARVRLNIPATDFVFLWFGRLSPIDKCDLSPVLRAFRRVAERCGRVRLLIGGSASLIDYSHQISRHCAALGIEDLVRVVSNPSNEDKALLYSCADAFLAISDTINESFGITVAEALSMSLPVIAADWDGYRDHVVSGENGYLVRTLMTGSSEWSDETWYWPQPPVASFASAQAVATDVVELVRVMCQMAQSLPGERQRLQKNAKDHSRKYERSTMMARYEEQWRRSADRYSGSKYVYLPTPSATINTARIFGRYASSRLESSSLLTMTQDGDAIVEGDASLQGFSWLWSVDFDPELAMSVLRLVKASAPIDVGQIAAELADHTDPSRLEWHVVWLVKQGYLAAS